MRRAARWIGRRELAVVAAWFVLCNALAFAWLAQSPRLYEARQDLFVATSGNDLSTTYQRGVFALGRVQSYASLATTLPVLRDALQQVDPDGSAAELRPRVSASVPPQTVLVQIRVEDESPERAADLATAIAQVLVTRSGELDRADGQASPQVRLTDVGDGDVSRSPGLPDTAGGLTLANLAALVLTLASLAALTAGRAPVRSRADVTGAGSTTLAEVPPIAMADMLPGARGVRSPKGVKSATLEGFRILRSQISLALGDLSPQSVLVVPAGPSADAGAVALGLAHVLTESRQPSVLLVDGDLRTRAITRALWRDESAGLAEAIAHHEPASTTTSRQPDFEILGTGRPVPSPTDLLDSDSLTTVLDDLGRDFEHLVVVAPPVLAGADASLWSRRLSGAVVVARQGVTPVEELTRSVWSLHRAGATVLGVVLVT